MPIAMSDPTFELLNRRRQIDTASPYDAVRDNQELAEREDATDAYIGENEQHFVDYAMDCIKQSTEAMKDIRAVQNDCWNVYNENEPLSYTDKDEWQSRIIVPKPHQAVQYGAAAVKKAFTPKFLSIGNAQNKTAADFWQKVMEQQLNEQHSKFSLMFTDAVTMSLAVGISQEMIPRWTYGKGLEFSLVEPWKIHRDPDALSRDSQSGMFWIHQEWLDYFVLKQGEQAGKYFDVKRVKEVSGEDPDDPFLTKEAIRARKEQIWDDRSKFRKLILTSEFWGIVLSPNGEVLLPRATYTIAGGRVIQKPKTSPYRKLRWPGIAFSPLPDILRFGGRGLLEGVLTVWEAMNNIMCLHQDYLQWVVNPPTEINVDGLVDPEDVEMWPGKNYLTRDTVSGQQVVRSVQRRSRTNDVLSNMQYYDQQFQRGSFVTDAVQGLPGYRQDMTYREAAMNLDQAMGVYGLMGSNIEAGAIDALVAAQEIVEMNAGFMDYVRAVGEEVLLEAGIMPNPETDSGVSGIPSMDGTFHVSGIQALMRNAETIQAIKEVILPLANDPRMGQYIKPYATLKALEERYNLTDEGIIVEAEEAQQIDQQQQQTMQEQLAMSKERMGIDNSKVVSEVAKNMAQADKLQADGGEQWSQAQASAQSR
ncbi:MAG: hypothetical protein ABIL06_13250 [Pseudomonadota bacterium]|uniref:Putative portal protein n=1 Tax=viral metagenome TaxID=1070528 RepID=A0A6H1ZH99_9ZZZZ